ncbi:unnamed protein product [Phytophthora lilii]|uniref:Unnamed protein product n=1 Tax=Phytophthora lilii TaxID=2077276 RepID=A0A9W6WXF7_9STRA|nr:unnamed protein product [Phytophthora lilii]
MAVPERERLSHQQHPDRRREKPLTLKVTMVMEGDISVQHPTISTLKILLDYGAATIYVSKRWVEEHQLKTTKFQDKNIRVKLGDNQIVEAERKRLPLDIVIPGLDEAYKSVAVVYAIPDEFDCILGTSVLQGYAITDRLEKSTNQQNRNKYFGLETDRRDLQTDRGRRTGNVVENMFTMGIVDETGVQTKYITRKITRKKLRKFLKIKTKSIEEPDFMLVLSKQTIKQVARSL